MPTAPVPLPYTMPFEVIVATPVPPFATPTWPVNAEDAGMFVSVFVEPLIDLLVRVCVLALPVIVSALVGRVNTTPLFVMVTPSSTRFVPANALVAQNRAATISNFFI
jgi:hypothetical protein